MKRSVFITVMTILFLAALTIVNHGSDYYTQTVKAQSETPKPAVPAPAEEISASTGSADSDKSDDNTEDTAPTPTDPNATEAVTDPDNNQDTNDDPNSSENVDDSQAQPVVLGLDDSALEGFLESGDIKAPEPMESINLNNVEMRVIIQKLGEWTDKPIIPTSDEVMQKRITIFSNKQVPRSQALSLFYDALRAKDIIAEQLDDKIYLKPITQARQGYVPTLKPDDPLARIEDKSMVVEKFFKLRTYSPSRLVQVIQPLLANYGHVTAIESTNDIVVIDTVENLIRIERIISQLDVPESDQIVEQIFEIENADPAEIVQVLQMILSDGSSSSRSNDRGFRGPPRPTSTSGSENRGQTTPATSVTITSTEIPIKLIPMTSQNWIIARASNADMDLIEKWIKKLDVVEATPRGQTVIPVRYVDPREVANAVENALEDMPGTDLRSNIVIEALSQSKQIIVWGSTENRKTVEILVAQIDLPSKDIFIEKTFKLKHADPDQIKTNIEGLFDGTTSSSSSRYGGWGGYNRYSSSNSNEDIVKVISYPTRQSVTVIASEENMKKIAKQIQEEWDVPLDITKDQYRILTLKNSDPVQLTQLLSTLFSETSSSGSASNNMLRMIMGGRGGTEADEKSKIVGPLYGLLTFEAVPGTKKIIVISKIPEAYDVIEKVVKDLDSEEKAEIPKVITLKYADAEDLCDQLNAILNEPGTTATLPRASQGLSDYSAEAGSSVAGSEDTAGTITPWWNRARVATGEEMPTSNLIGQVRFIPVYRSKAVLVLAPPEYMEDIKAMIEALDQPGMQVMVKVVIVQVDHDNMTSLGVQLSSNPAAFGAIGTDALSALTELTRPLSYGKTIGNAYMDINVLVDLLVQKTEARVLNQPTLWTKDNKEAVFIKGAEIALLDQSNTNTTNQNSITNTYTYTDVGVTLRVRPNITPEKEVDMTINLNISEVGPDINSQVSINKLDTTTSLIVKNGQTIMLGGILFRNDTKTQKKIPLLGDIPIVGEAFKHTETQQRNNELLAFVTPYVIDAENLKEVPADLNTMERIAEPRIKMEDILSELDIPAEKVKTTKPTRSDNNTEKETHDNKKDDSVKPVNVEEVTPTLPENISEADTDKEPLTRAK